MFTRLVILVFFAHVIGNRTAQAQSCALHTNLLNERMAVHTLHHVDQANLVLEGVSDPRTQDDDNGHNLEATQPTAYVELRNRRSLPTPRRKSKTKVSWIQFRTLCDVPKEHPETTRGALNVTMMAWNAVRRVAAPSGIHFKLNVVGVRPGGAANSQHVVHERTLLSHTLGRENIQYVFTSALWQQPNRPSRRGSEVSEHLELILEDRYAFQRFIPLRVGMYLWYDNRSILPDPALMPIVRSGSDLKQSFKAGPVPTLFSPHFTVLGSDFLRQILPFLNVVNTRRLFQVSPNRKVVEEEEEEEEKVGVERENMVVASLRKFLSHAQLDGRSSIKTHEQLNKQNRCVRKVIPVSSTFQCAKTPAMICQTDDGEYLFPWLSEYYATRGLCRLFVVQPLDAKGISGVDVHHTGSVANLTESTPLIESSESDSELEHIPIKGRRKNRMRQLFAKKDVQPWNETSNQTQEPSEKDPEGSHRAGTKQLVKNVHPRLQFQFGAAPIFSKYPHTGKVVLVLLTAWIYRNVPTSSNVRFVLERESSQTYPRTLQFNTRVTMNGPLGGSSSRNDEPDASVLKDLWAESLSTPPREHYTPFAQVYALNGSHAEEWADLSSHSRLSFSFTYDSTEESTLHVRDVLVALTVLHPAVWRSILTAQTPPTPLIAQTIRFHRSTRYRATQTVLAPLVDLAHTKKVHTISLWAPVLVLGIVTLVLLCCINIVVVLNVFRRRYVRYYLPEDAFFTT